MSCRPQEQPARRVMWWTRTFGRPLQAEIGGIDTDTPQEFEDLLDQADQRLGLSRCKSRDR